MSDPDDEKLNMFEKAVIMKAMLEQSTMIITCLMAVNNRHEITFTKQEIADAMKTFEVVTDVKTSETSLIAVHLALKLRS